MFYRIRVYNRFVEIVSLIENSMKLQVISTTNLP